MVARSRVELRDHARDGTTHVDVFGVRFDQADGPHGGFKLGDRGSRWRGLRMANRLHGDNGANSKNKSDSGDQRYGFLHVLVSYHLRSSQIRLRGRSFI